MTTDVQQAYESGVLNPSIHSRLVSNLDHFAQKANIQVPMITSKMSVFDCSPEEIDYVKSIKRKSAEGVYGLVYHGRETTSVAVRMSAVAGACLRNFVDARVMVLQELLSLLKDGEAPDATVLLIPNFFISRADGGKIAEWHIAELLGLLYGRMAKGLQTFLYVSDLQSLAKAYGDPIANHLMTHFRAVPA